MRNKRVPPYSLLQVGADVEIFTVTKDSKVPVPCVGVVGGTKEAPLPLPNLPSGFARQEDNVMLEFNIPPANSCEMFVQSIDMALTSIRGLLEEKSLSYVVKPSMRFDEKDLLSEQAKTFGCDPDFSVWDRCQNEVAHSPGLSSLRTAGGHVHVSFLLNGKIPRFPDDIELLENVVMGMDIFLGCPFSMVDRDADRRLLYGKAGAFRIKPYGIEYRTLSNYWIGSTVRTQFLYLQVMRCFDWLNKCDLSNLNSSLRHNMQKYIQNAINNSDAESASYVNECMGVGQIDYQQLMG